MIVVIGQFRLPPDALEEARPVMRQVMLATRAEHGCIQYNYSEDLLDPGLIQVSEVWETREQLAAHLETEHMALWRQQREALGMSGRQLKAYETDVGTEL